MPLVMSDFDNCLKMKSKWVYIDPSIKKKEVSVQNTAKEEVCRENLAERTSDTFEV